MKTRTINFKNKSSVFWKYFTENTTDTRCMRNTANFYIRNTMTGIRKSPEERTALETEVLHDVFTGIQKANREAEERFLSKLERLVKSGGMKSAVRRSRLVQTVFSYPTKDKWFLNYETLDAIFKETNHPVYRRMNSQSFVSIPFQKLRETIRMIANREGIPVVMQDESYTSKASCLDQDPVPDYKEGETPPEFSGKRTKRGLYRSANGILINADVNRAANIIRKRYPDAFKGQRMDYLYRTTETVNIQDWYLPYRERRNLRKHTCSKISRVRHGDRSERIAELMRAFGCTRKVWKLEKTAA